MATKITVTADDIAQGVCGGPSCPVKLACARAFGVHVSAGYQYIVRGGTERVATPEPVRRWMGEFDAERPVQPFTFELGAFEPFTGQVPSWH